MAVTEKLYKVLDLRGCSTIQAAPWKLPKNGKPGAWMPAIKGDLVACQRGYHLCRVQDLIFWLGPVIYEAEQDGEERVTVEEGESKIVVRRARLIRRVEAWNDQSARLFAADCAERVLPIFERNVPGDVRPRECIRVARQFANGEATAEQLATAWDAARAAARDAAGDAAWATARAAAGAAAWDAARAAAGAAAWATAWAAERAWQAARLSEVLGFENP